MKLGVKGILFLLLSLVALAGGCGDTGGLAVAGKAGTLGYGGELTAKIRSDVNARVGINTLDWDFDGDVAGIDYDMGLDLSSFTALVDWFPFNGPLRITSGVIVMNNELGLRARGSSGELEGIGDGTYDWANVGTLFGDASVDDVAPYIGIGWGNILDKSKRWGFYSDFGVAFTQSPDVSLSSSGTAPGLALDLLREQTDIEDELEPFKYYPVLSAGFFIRF
jgi:hypothetical protein